MTTFMRREIDEIPEVAARLLSEGAGEFKELAHALRSLDPAVIVSVARGSSDHVATYFKYICEIAMGVPVASIGPSIASVYGADLKLPRAAALAISQSGQSPDIVAMTKAACAQSIALTNTPASPLGTASTHCVDLRAGPEKSVAATKSFAASAIAALAIVAHWSENSDMLHALARLPEDLARAIACDWSPLNDLLDGRDALYVLGRGPSFAIAHEIALKFKETSNVHAEAYSSAEVLHGPAALVDNAFPVLGLAAHDAAAPLLRDVAQTLHQRGAPVCLAAPEAEQKMALPIIKTGHSFTDPIALIASFYSFVEAFSHARGLDPDSPRNLKKVTETQ